MKIAIITGASSGLGRDFAIQISELYKELDEIWIIARRKERLEELKTKLSVPTRIFTGDLAKSSLYAALQQELTRWNPEIRILVNAAGFGKNGSVEGIFRKDKEAQLDMIQLNCVALTQMTLLILPYCRKGSQILNVASASAFCPQPGFSVYAATKSYVLSFSRSLASELKNSGICVTAVCPGPVRTEFFKTSGAVTNPLKEKTMAESFEVVKQALLDARKKKTISIYGATMKISYIFARLLPHSLIMKLLYENTFQANDSETGDE